MTKLSYDLHYPLRKKTRLLGLRFLAHIKSKVVSPYKRDVNYELNNEQTQVLKSISLLFANPKPDYCVSPAKHATSMAYEQSRGHGERWFSVVNMRAIIEIGFNVHVKRNRMIIER